MTESAPPHTVPRPRETRIVTVVEDGQATSDEQRERICAWLRANDVDPKTVSRKAITIEYADGPFGRSPGRIWFTQYYVNAEGSKEHAIHTNEAVQFRRCVQQTVELEPDPRLPDLLAAEEEHRKAWRESQRKNADTAGELA
jgi:hypothetical protein